MESGPEFTMETTPRKENRDLFQISKLEAESMISKIKMILEIPTRKKCPWFTNNANHTIRHIRSPACECLILKFSSGKVPPYIDSLPLPSPRTISPP